MKFKEIDIFAYIVQSAIEIFLCSEHAVLLLVKNAFDAASSGKLESKRKATFFKTVQPQPSSAVSMASQARDRVHFQTSLKQMQFFSI